MVRACQVNLWLAEGNLAEAQGWAQSNFPQMPASVPFLRELDHICLSRIWVANQHWEEASDLLQQLAEAALEGKRFGRLLKIDILRALVLNGLGRGEESLELLESCLRFAYPEGYMRVFLDEGAALKALLQDGKRSKTWKDPEVLNHAEKLIKAF
jgi:LuxR family maltose regulon positive regulatory protein